MASCRLALRQSFILFYFILRLFCRLTLRQRLLFDGTYGRYNIISPHRLVADTLNFPSHVALATSMLLPLLRCLLLFTYSVLERSTTWLYSFPMRHGFFPARTVFPCLRVFNEAAMFVRRVSGIWPQGRQLCSLASAFSSRPTLWLAP